MSVFSILQNQPMMLITLIRRAVCACAVCACILYAVGAEGPSPLLDCVSRSISRVFSPLKMSDFSILLNQPMMLVSFFSFACVCVFATCFKHPRVVPFRCGLEGLVSNHYVAEGCGVVLYAGLFTRFAWVSASLMWVVFFLGLCIGILPLAANKGNSYALRLVAHIGSSPLIPFLEMFFATLSGDRLMYTITSAASVVDWDGVDLKVFIPNVLKPVVAASAYLIMLFHTSTALLSGHWLLLSQFAFHALLTGNNILVGYSINLFPFAVVVEEVYKDVFGAKLFAFNELCVKGVLTPPTLLAACAHIFLEYLQWPFQLRCVAHVVWNTVFLKIIPWWIMRGMATTVRFGEEELPPVVTTRIWDSLPNFPGSKREQEEFLPRVRAQVLDVFVPRFAPHFDTTVVHNLTTELSEVYGVNAALWILLSRDFPVYRMKAYVNAVSRRVLGSVGAGREATVRKIRDRREGHVHERDQNRKQPLAKFKAVAPVKRGKKSDQTFRLCKHVYPNIPLKSKPTASEYTVPRFRAWVVSVASSFLPIDKGMYITGSHSTEALWYGVENVSVKVLEAMLATATVGLGFWVDAKEKLRKPPQISLGDFFAPGSLATMGRALSIGGRVYRSADELTPLLPFFRKSMSLYRMATRAFMEDSDIDCEKLEKMIATKVAFPQGNAPSVNVNHEGVGIKVDMTHSVDVNSVSDAIAALQDALVATGTQAVSSHSRVIAQIVSFLAAAFAADSWASLLAAVMQFVSGNDYLWQKLQDLVERLRATPVLQGDGETFSFGLTSIKEALSSRIFIPLWSLVVECGALTIVSELGGSLRDFFAAPLRDLVGAVRFGLLKETGMSIAKSILSGVTEVLARISSCIKTRSWGPLWGKKYDPIKYIETCSTFISYYTVLTCNEDASVEDCTRLADLRRRGLISDEFASPIPIKDFIVLCGDHYRLGLSLVEYFRSSPPIHQELMGSVRRFEAFVDGIRATELGSGLRVRPFAIYMHGVVGGGKSNLAQMLVHVLSRATSSDPLKSYMWQTKVNFQDGLDHSHRFITVDDQDQSVAPPSAAQKTIFEEMISLINNAPFPVEKADINQKSKVFAYPQYVQFLSNYTTEKVTSQLTDPNAFWRRFLYKVQVAAKAEFALNPDAPPMERLMDANKVRNAEVHDIYEIMVSKFDATKISKDDRNVLPYGPAVSMSLSAFTTMLTTDYQKHIEHEVERIKRVAGAATFCPTCYLSSDKPCGCPVPQGYRDLASCHQVKAYFEYLRDRILRYPREMLYEFRDSAVRMGRLVVAQYSAAFFASIAAVGAAIGVGIYLFKTGVSHFQGRNMNGGGDLRDWVRVDQTQRVALPGLGHVTFTKEELVAAIRASFVTVSGPLTTGGLIVGPGLVLCPTHAVFETCGTGFKEEGIALITIPSVEPVRVRFNIGYDAQFYGGNSDLCLLRVGFLGTHLGAAKKFWYCQDAQISQFDAVEAVGPDGLKAVIPRHEMAMIPGTDRVVRKNLKSSWPSRVGDCGTIMIGCHNGRWSAVAMHWAGTELGANAFAAIVDQHVLQQTASKIASVVTDTEMVKTSLVKQGMPGVNPYPHKSEVWAALSQGALVYPIGELYPPGAGSSNKTALQWSIAKEDFTALATEWCGEPDYWVFPKFGGYMRDGVWWSPFVEAFAASNRAQEDSKLFWVALADYLSGIEELDFSGFQPLSPEQALSGIPGTAVKSVNLRTSVGPPFKEKKFHHIVLDPVEGSLRSPETARMDMEIAAILGRGNVPLVIGEASLKDEGLKVGKIPRVFTNLPEPLNTRLKAEFVPYILAMRAYPSFFESFVGVNMTGSGCNDVVAHLASVNPALDIIYDADGKKVDKSYTSKALFYVSLAKYAVAKAAGCDPTTIQLLTTTAANVVFSIKGDLFLAPWNASGKIDTVEENGIRMSLGSRQVYYARERDIAEIPDSVVREFVANFLTTPYPSPELRKFLDFRSKNCLATYGDDLLWARAEEIRFDVEEAFLETTGMVVTDGGKLNKISRKDIFGVEFLKRQFRWDDELGRYVARLSKKSMARTLLVKKDSVLSGPDHLANGMSEVLRELVYWGEVEYCEALTLFTSIATKYGVETNAYWRVFPYAHWREKMRDGTFSAWEAWSPLGLVEGSGIVYQGTMSEPTIVKAGDDPAGNDQKIVPTTKIVHEVGEMTSESSMKTSQTEFKQRVEQKFPSTELGNFLERPTEIRTYTLNSSNNPTAYVADFNPFADYHSNARVMEKTSTFAYIRGTMILTFVTAAPGMSYGEYVISAVPRGGVTFDTSFKSHNCLEVDHYVRLDMSSSPTVEMALPWLYKWDYADIAEVRAGTKPMWTIVITCLAPVKQAIPGGVTVATMQVFARYSSDVEMVVPHFQGKQTHSKHAHAALAKVASVAAPTIAHKAKSAHAAVDAVASVADKLGSVPIIGPYAASAAKIAHGASKLMGMFGFTRESVEQKPMPIVGRSVTNVAHYEGDDAADSASFSMCAEISPDPTIAGASADDELSFASIGNRWGLLKRFTWTPALVKGDLLATVWVTPGYMQSIFGSSINIYPTPVGYIGLPFEEWRGDMEYMVIIPVSKVHRGSYQAYWMPFGTSGSPTVTNATLNQIVDVSADTTEIFRVGYAREKPFCENRYFTDIIPIVPVGSTNGRLVLRVINPLTAPDPNASVTGYVFCRAGKNMQFAKPRDRIELMKPDASGLEVVDMPALQFQGAVGDEGPGDAEVIHDLVPSSGDFAADEMFYGEVVSSARALFQKPSRQMWTAAYLPEDQAYLQLPKLGQRNGQLDPFGRWTWQSHYRQLFVGLAASERFKVFAANCYAGGSNMRTIGAAVAPTLAPVSYTGPNNGYEFNIPWYVPQKFLGTDSTDVPDRNAVFCVDVYSGQPNGGIWYHSYGPDIRSAGYSYTPVITWDNQWQGPGFFNTPPE